jgi:transcription elongation GreA/GreB family factor
MSFSPIKVNTKVTLKHGDSKITYQIVSPDKVSPIDHKISLNSPLVQELMKNQSNRIRVNTPRGEVEYEVLEELSLYSNTE